MNTEKERTREERRQQTRLYSKKVAKICLSVFSVLSCLLAIVGFLLLQTAFDDKDVFKAFVEKNYILSALVMIFICAIQVIIALIPGELVEITAGYAFGAFGGAIITLIGITLGSVIVLLLSKRYGRRLVESIYPKEKLDAIPIINEPKKRNALTAILFLIPGTPKDLLTYAVGLTDMSIPLYLAIATAARFPSIIISTVGGDALGDDRFIHAIIAFIVSAVVSLVGYLIYLRISKKRKK